MCICTMKMDRGILCEGKVYKMIIPIIINITQSLLVVVAVVYKNCSCF